MSLAGKSNRSDFKVLKERMELNPLNLKLYQKEFSRESLTTGGLYFSSNYIDTTESCFGMPQGSNDRIFIRKTTPGQIQVSSTSADDTAAGTGARVICIEGLRLVNNLWLPAYEEFTMNGQTPVVSVESDWWRINKMFVLEAGSTQRNQGAIYVSPQGSVPVAGVPPVGNTLGAMLSLYSVSTMGMYSIASGKQQHLYNQNFFADSGVGADLLMHEFYFENFEKNVGNPLIRYEVATYKNVVGALNNLGYQPYDEESDVYLTIRRSVGSQTSPNDVCYYMQYQMADKVGLTSII